MKNSYEYRQRAKELLKGKYREIILLEIAYLLVAGILTSLHESFLPKYEIVSWIPFQRVLISAGNPALAQFFNFIGFVLGALVAFAFLKLFLTFASEQRQEKTESTFISGLKEQPLRSVLFRFYRTIFIFLWGLLLIIPGIMAAYKYATGYYILNKEKQWTAFEALEHSKQLMLGKRMDLFRLDVSYLGWYLLGLLTLGILWFWIVPRHSTARVLFFNDVYATPVEPSN